MKLIGKKKLALVGVIISASFVLLVVLIQFISQPADQPTEQPSVAIFGEAAATNLGFSYLQITPRIAAYYNIDVTTGALITDVVANSPADKVGLQKGDIISSFNGIALGDTAPLLGLMMSCPLGHIIEMETLREAEAKTVTFIHTDQ